MMEINQNQTNIALFTLDLKAEKTATNKAVLYLPALIKCDLSRRSLYLLKHCNSLQIDGRTTIKGFTHEFADVQTVECGITSLDNIAKATLPPSHLVVFSWNPVFTI